MSPTHARRLVVVVAVLAAVAGALAACGVTDRADEPTPSGTVDDTFMTQMARHDADARQLARLARARSDDAAVLDSAHAAGSPGWDHESMRTRMHRRGDGGSMTGRSDGPGMDALRTCPAQDFDRRWNQTMRSHLGAVLDDAAAERAHGSDTEVRAWAGVVATDAHRQLDALPSTP